MTLRNMKKTIVLFIIWAMVFGVFAIVVTQNASVKAAEITSIVSLDELVFTPTASSEGYSAYKVALKTTSRPTAQSVIVPESYDGKPVTEIADSAFLSCGKLQKVVLPLSIEKIGMNAFMNCAKLERVVIPPQVKTIGNNAFGMCVALERLYIPKAVEKVGSTILRNNKKDIYIQAAAPGDGWSPTWKDYHTGEVHTNTEPSDMANYREILDSAGEVIGYELVDIGAMDTDMVIYSSFSPNPEQYPYKPVLNILSEAFTFSGVNSLTIKHRHVDDPSAPIFDHPINIRSQAFAYSFINEINIEVDTTYYHPVGLEIPSQFGELVVGDEYGRSTYIFYNSSVAILTVKDLDSLPSGMFADCASLSEIKIFGKAYNGQNWLPQIESIGSNAFQSCISLENVYIPDTILAGEKIFDGWGDGYVHQMQTIYFDKYADEITSWSENWDQGINYENVSVLYKPLAIITLHHQDGTGATDTISVKPGDKMPVVEKPIREGYIFKGYFAQPNGSGLQYYTDTMISAQTWNDGDPTNLYAHWESGTFPIEYIVDWKGLANPNPVEYKAGSAISFINLQKEGYTFAWSIAGISANTTGKVTVVGTWTPIEYAITYDVDLFGLINPNPVSYTVEMLPLRFSEVSRVGYDLVWTPASLEVGTLGAQKVTGVWQARDYSITFVANGGDGALTMTEKYDTYVTLPDGYQLDRQGYYLAKWQTAPGIFTPGVGTATDGTQYAVGTMGHIQDFNSVLYAVWKPITYTIRLNANNGSGKIREINATYDNEMRLPLNTFQYSGYSFIWWSFTPDGMVDYDDGGFIQNVTSLHNDVVDLYARWTPNSYPVTFDKQGGTGGNDWVPADYGCIMPTAFAPTRDGYKFEGYFAAANGKGIKFYSADMNSTVTYIWTEGRTLYAYWTPLDFDDTYHISFGYRIYCYEQLIQFRDRANADSYKYLGKTVRLKSDIDLQNIRWTPINDTYFIFYGEGHTISNLYISQPLVSGETTYAAFFGRYLDPRPNFKSNTSAIVDLKFKNVRVVVSGNGSAAFVSAIVGKCDGMVLKCQVDNLYIEVMNQNSRAGGIAGEAYFAKFSECVVSNARFKCHCMSGGIVGVLGDGATVENCQFSGYMEAYKYSVTGGIVGVSDGDIKGCTSSGTIRYVSPKEDGDEKMSVSPIIGTIIGSNRGKYASNSNDLVIEVPVGILGVYTTGSLWGKKENDQAKYVGGYNGEKTQINGVYQCRGQIGKQN